MNDHWGTSNTVDSKIVFDEPGSIAYSFSTKWEPPVEFVNTLEKLYPDVEIFFDYLREIDDENCVDEYEPEEDLPEAEITQEENNQEKCEAGTNDTFVSESVVSDSAPTQVVADDDFGEWFESTIRDEALSKKDEYRNVIIMDDENIEMFKKLYGYDCQNGKRTFFDILLSFSRIIPEPIMDESDKNWFDNTEHDGLFGVARTVLKTKCRSLWLDGNAKYGGMTTGEHLAKPCMIQKKNLLAVIFGGVFQKRVPSFRHH